MELSNIVKHRLKIIAFGCLGTLIDELQGMQSTLSKLVGPLKGQIDLFKMASDWQASLERAYHSSYMNWTDLAIETLEATCKQYGVVDPQAYPDEFRYWVKTWPTYEDQHWLGRLGRRFQIALLSQMDRACLSGLTPSLARPVDYLICSDLACAFKPSPGFFKLLRVQLKLEEPEELLVISARPDLDLEPAAAEGYQTLLVERDEDSDSSNFPDIIRFLG